MWFWRSYNNLPSQVEKAQNRREKVCRFSRGVNQGGRCFRRTSTSRWWTRLVAVNIVIVNISRKPVWGPTIMTVSVAIAIQ